jgi:hypothetical protein
VSARGQTSAIVPVFGVRDEFPSRDREFAASDQQMRDCAALTDPVGQPRLHDAIQATCGLLEGRTRRIIREGGHEAEVFIPRELAYRARHIVRCAPEALAESIASSSTAFEVIRLDVGHR